MKTIQRSQTKVVYEIDHRVIFYVVEVIALFMNDKLAPLLLFKRITAAVAKYLQNAV